MKVVETQENNSNPENQQVNTIHRGNGSNENYVGMVGSSTLGCLNSKNLFDREGPVFEHGAVCLTPRLHFHNEQ